MLAQGGADVADFAERDAAFLFALYAERITYADLPPDVVDMTKKGILDTIGVILPAGTTSPETRELVDLMLDAGGKQEATILGFGRKLPAWHAGYVNGAMANCQDYSDLHPNAAHISSPVIPAALAMAERLGNVDGERFITAVALGVDLQCRLTLAAGKPGGKMAPWHPAPLFGVFAAALACAKLLSLDWDKMVNALGLAFVQAAGTHEIVFGKDSTIRGFGHAVPGEVGLRAALMAERGITGVRNSFEGAAGLWNVYYQGDYDRDALVGDLGTRWAVRDDGFKPWPSCGFTHVHIDMIRELVREHGVTPDEVEAITVTVGDFARGQTEPLEEWRRPTNAMLAKLSIPYNVATAMRKGDVTIRDFFDENLNDADTLAMADRVFARFDPRYNFLPGAGFPGGALEIRTRNGRRLTREQSRAYGHPEKPMSWNGLIAKFRDCASYAAVPATADRIDRAVAMLRNLEQVSDVAEIVALIG
jgi:2-methylcitrate dehydratase PrpD